MNTQSIVDVLSFSASISLVIIANQLKKPAQSSSRLPENAETIEFLRKCTVSAPGKALIAGGYLVLEYPNIGVTIASSSCFHSTVKLQAAPNRTEPEDLDIVIESPQFYSTFSFRYIIRSGLLERTSPEANVFIEKCTLLALSYAREFHGPETFCRVLTKIAQKRKLCVKLRADNDFYSQISELKRRGLPLLSSSLHKLPAFMPCPKDEHGNVRVSKTGMGSSAALATSLVGALLHSLRVVTLTPPQSQSPSASPSGEPASQPQVGAPAQSPSPPLPSSSSSWSSSPQSSFEQSLRIVHNVSQLAHAVAQGKIGSGFDVAAAVYGSQCYRRFDPTGLQACLDLSFSDEGSMAAQTRLLREVVESAELWSQLAIKPLALPPGLGLLMGDICGGSSSTSMAKEVLRWRKGGGKEVEDIWGGLAKINQQVADLIGELNELSKLDESEYTTGVRLAASVSGGDWASLLDRDAQQVSDRTVSTLSALREALCTSRTLLKLMGNKAGVEIEPDCQTQLANATQELPGVLCSGVPGAGGVDAIYAITLSDSGRASVEDMWSRWQGEGGGVVCPLLLTERRSAAGLGPDSPVHAGVAVNPTITWYRSDGH